MSKHSQYQELATGLRNVLDIKDSITIKRYEKERLNYTVQNLNPSGANVLDIGGNTGYFTFELLSRGAESVDYYEGNQNHANFVSLAANVLNYQNKVTVYDEYYLFLKNSEKVYDIVLLLNVLHHVGDDYGDKNLNITNAKKEIISNLNCMAERTTYLVFQLGFNWKGNRNLGLFEHGTKRELIDFILSGCNKYWEIINVGISVMIGSDIIY